MKRQNLMIIIGGVIIGLILVVMLFPNMFTKINPYDAEYVKLVNKTSESLSVKSPPFPPSGEYPLGSDMLGRDIYSLIIYGTRLTVLLGICVALGRFLIALPLGIAAGFGNRSCKLIVKQFSTIFSSIPMLIISVMILDMKFFSSLYKRESIIAFTIVLSLVGFGKLAQLIEERATGIIGQPFIKGEIATGKSKGRIALENVIPHLSAEIVIFFFMEISIALVLIMQLGVFKIFVGGLKILDGDFDSVMMLSLSFEPEWASMLGAARQGIISSYWTVIYPALAFFITIFGFNLFAEGLRAKLQNKDSRFITRIRRSLSFEVHDLKFSNLHPIRGKFRVFTILITAAFIYTIIIKVSNVKYDFNIGNISYGKQYDEIIVGSKEAEETANIIAKEFKTNGYKPVSKNGFIVPYDIKDENYCYFADVDIGRKESSLKMILGKDFAPASFEDHSFSGEIYDTTKLDLFSLIDYKSFDNKVVLINGNIYSREAMLVIAGKIIKNSRAKGILLLLRNGERLPAVFGSNVLKLPIAWITQDALNKINQLKDKSITADIKCKKLTGMGRNIIGLLPGTDEKLKDEVILLGLDYNYLNSNKRFGVEKIKFNIQMLRKLASMKRERSIIVAFWDGTLNDTYNGKVYYSNNPVYPSVNVDAYIDLTKLSVDKSNNIEFNSDLAPASRFLAWQFAHDLKVNLGKKTKVVNYDNIRDQQTVLRGTPNEDEAMFYTGTMPVIMVANKELRDNGMNRNPITIDDIGYVILKSIQENNY